MARWRERLACEDTEAAALRTAMRAVNPAYIPRNHRVESVIRAAVDQDDFGPFEELLTVLATPFAEQPDLRLTRSPRSPTNGCTKRFAGRETHALRAQAPRFVFCRCCFCLQPTQP